MQGRQAFDPKAKTVIDLDSFVADDHLLRRVDRVLGLSFVRELTAGCYFDGRGRPSIDPEVYFRMLLVEYLYGITSDRRLCEEVRYNLAYRWFCRLSLEDDVPDHSSLSRIQGRYGEATIDYSRSRISTQRSFGSFLRSRVKDLWVPAGAFRRIAVDGNRQAQDRFAGF